jgi:putative ABC transport system permease protein
MSGLGRVVRAGVGRRKVQTLVIVLATAMAATAAVLGGALLAASDAPYDKAFAAQNGAHLNVQFAAGKVTADKLAATASTAGVTATAGPLRTSSVRAQGGPDTGILAGQSLPPITVAARADQAGAVDDLVVTQGAWLTAPGQIVLSADGRELPLGTTLLFPEIPGAPALKVVGFARSVSRSADGWVLPADVAALRPTGYQMLYRFAKADTEAEVAADRAAVAAEVPAGAITGGTSWLAVRAEAVRETSLLIPFLIAFSVLGLIMSVLIVGNVVAGAVGLATRRIGILKSLGSTPAQVVAAYVGQALIPSAAGAVLGTLLGNVLARPLLDQTANAYSATSTTVAPWIDVVVVAGCLAVVAVTACACAWRAGRLRTVDAIAVGRTPRSGRGRRAARVGAALPLPRSVGLGLAAPFARPVRALAIVAAVAFGTTAVTFAVGLASSLTEVQTAKNHDVAAVTVDAFNRQTGPRLGGVEAAPLKDPAAISAAITRQPGVAAYFGLAQHDVTVAGLSGAVTMLAFTDDATASGYELISGRWFHGPGEAIVPTPFLTASGTSVGDTVVVTDHGTERTVTIVGEVFDIDNDGRSLLADAATFPGAGPTSYQIVLSSGTDANNYAAALNKDLAALGVTAHVNQPDRAAALIDVIKALAGALTLMLVVVAGLGVLNVVVLDTRERVHDIGVYKALGMVPGQTVSMVVASVVLVGLIGGAIGVPAGWLVHAVIAPAMGHGAGTNLPASALDVYRISSLVLLAAGGIAIAVLGALLPAGWAARSRTATALRTE